MTYNSYVHCEVDCGDAHKAKSRPISYHLHKMNDGLKISYLRKQNNVGEQVCLFSLRMQLHFLPVVCLLAQYIVEQLVCLFQIFCNVFLILGTVFLFALLPYPQGFFYVFLYKPFDKLGKYVIDRQPFVYAVGIRIITLFHCIFDKVSSPYNTFNEKMETSIPC